MNIIFPFEFNTSIKIFYFFYFLKVIFIFPPPIFYKGFYFLKFFLFFCCEGGGTLTRAAPWPRAWEIEFVPHPFPARSSVDKILYLFRDA